MDIGARGEGSVEVFRATLDRLEAAREAIVRIHERPVPNEDALAAFLADEANYLLIATEGGRVVGALDGHALRRPERPEPQFLLYEVDVLEPFRRRGVGKALVRAFAEEARRAGAFEVWVITNASNPAALALYAACGFGRDNPDDVMMSLPTA